MGKGRSLELYFIDGKPDGMLTAEVFNWTGHVLKIPRTRIADALRRPETEYTGVYILLGDLEGQPQAYIGEAEDLKARIRGHVTKKDWWETAVLITSTANNLHKAHVKYLESRLVELALEAKRMPLENGNVPTRSSLSESGVANMESFLETLMMVLPAIQVDMFDDKVIPSIKDMRQIYEVGLPEFELFNAKYGIAANAYLLNGNLVVRKGSKAGKSWTGTSKNLESYMKKREVLFKNGIIRLDGDTAYFSDDYAFSSASLAAVMTSGRYTQRTAWKLKGTNKTYADWEAEQIEKDD